MPFTSDEISVAGKYALDWHLKNNPVDQIAQERPLLKKLVSMQRAFPGGKQYVTETLRVRYDSNFQWFYGSQAVTYNSRDPVEEVNFPWRGWHDGFFLDEDRLAQNGIALHDGNKGGASNDEWHRLQDVLEESISALRLGVEEAWNLQLFQDGSQSVEAFGGLDFLVATNPATGSPGGINRATAGNEYWRNNASLNVSNANLLTTMESRWRDCVRNGGRPDYIIAGSNFIDTYKAVVRAQGEYQLDSGGVRLLDGGVGMQTQGTDTGLNFKGVPIVWDPTFADLDDLLSPAVEWEDRCYFLQCRHLKLRPMRGHDMISRRPPREYNRYVWYWALTWKGALTMNKARCHAVIEAAGA